MIRRWHPISNPKPGRGTESGLNLLFVSDWWSLPCRDSAALWAGVRKKTTHRADFLPSEMNGISVLGSKKMVSFQAVLESSWTFWSEQQSQSVFPSFLILNSRFLLNSSSTHSNIWSKVLPSAGLPRTSYWLVISFLINPLDFLGQKQRGGRVWLTWLRTELSSTLMFIIEFDWIDKNRKIMKNTVSIIWWILIGSLGGWGTDKNKRTNQVSSLASFPAVGGNRRRRSAAVSFHSGSLQPRRASDQHQR